MGKILQNETRDMPFMRADLTKEAKRRLREWAARFFTRGVQRCGKSPVNIRPPMCGSVANAVVFLAHRKVPLELGGTVAGRRSSCQSGNQDTWSKSFPSARVRPSRVALETRTSTRASSGSSFGASTVTCGTSGVSLAGRLCPRRLGQPLPDGGSLGPSLPICTAYRKPLWSSTVRCTTTNPQRLRCVGEKCENGVTVITSTFVDFMAVTLCWKVRFQKAWRLFKKEDNDGHLKSEEPRTGVEEYHESLEQQKTYETNWHHVGESVFARVCFCTSGAWESFQAKRH